MPGGQNTDWHSDSPGHHAAFWDLLDYQNWVVDLWRVIASRYKNQAWVAGYNPLNEPTEKTGSKLLHFYDRVVKAIHEVDPDHLSKYHSLCRGLCVQYSSMEIHSVQISRFLATIRHIYGNLGLV